MKNDAELSKIMIVEDEPILLEAIKKRFETRGFLPLAFSTGEGALEYLQAEENKEDLPKVIWLDYYLGTMNGLEFVGTIKKDDVLGNIPVLVISNSATDEKVKKLLTLGVKKYLLKANHRLDDLITITTEFLEKDEDESNFKTFGA